MPKESPARPSRVPSPNGEAEGMDWLALAEYLWCHEHRERIFQPVTSGAKVEPEPKKPQPSAEARKVTPADDHKELRQQERKAENPEPPPDGKKLSLVSDPQVIPVDAPSAKAFQVPISIPVTLPGQRQLGKALRPLARRVRRGPLELDVEATVDRTAAHEGLFQPQMRRARERWLEVELLVDCGESVAFWQGLAGDVERMLALPGAFRRIRRWNLRPKGSQWAMETATGKAATLKPVCRERADRCILILTDTLSAPWFEPGGVELLAELAAKAPTALLHLLPSRLWERSGLGQGVMAKISSRSRGSGNHSWRATHPGGSYPLPPGLAVPCINFEAAHFGRLAGVFSGTKGNSVQGLLLMPVDTIPEPLDHSPAAESNIAKVEQFFIEATAEAAQLACYLAATPLVPPVMRMVQEVFMQESRHWHLTEVLCSGLVQPSPIIGQIDGMPCYDWLPEVRPLLLAQSPVADTRQVWRQVGTWLTRHQSPQMRHLAALMQHPQGNIETRVPAESRFFAEVNVAVWQSWGGEWAERGRRLAKRLEGKEVEKRKQRLPPAPPRRRLEGRRILWVDDHPDNNKWGRRSLGADGAEFVLALSTAEALPLLQKQPFDAIISDIGRKEGRKAGIDLLKRLRQAGNQIPFAIFAAPARQHQNEALKWGALVCTNQFEEVHAALLETLHVGVCLRPAQAAGFKEALREIGVEESVADRMLYAPVVADWDVVWSKAKNEAKLLEQAVTLVAAAADTGYHQIFDFRTGKLILVSRRVHRGRKIFKTVATRGVIGRCAQTRATVHVPDCRNDERYVLGEPRTLSELAIPLLMDGGKATLGVINIESDVVYRFNEKEVLWFESLAASLAEAWDALATAEKQPATDDLQQRVHRILQLPPRLIRIFAVRCGLRALPFTSDLDTLRNARRLLNLAELSVRREGRDKKFGRSEALEIAEAAQLVASGMSGPRWLDGPREVNSMEAAAALALRITDIEEVAELSRLFTELLHRVSQVVMYDVGADLNFSIDRVARHLLIIDNELNQMQSQRESKACIEDFGSLWPDLKRIESHPAFQPGKRVLVAGLGQADLPSDLREMSEELGYALAAAGYGLVCGGWPGVDEVVARTFLKRLEITGADVERFMQQVLDPTVDPPFKLKNAHASDSDKGSVRESIDQADVVILLGGAGGTKWIGEAALDMRVPVLPLAVTQGDAARLHSYISTNWRQFGFYGAEKELFEGLAASMPHALDAALRLVEKVPLAEKRRPAEAVDLSARGRLVQRGSKILFVGASPTEDPVDYRRELSVIRKSIGHDFNLVPLLSATPERLFDLIRDELPQVIHFCGQNEDDAGLVLETREGGRTLLKADALLSTRMLVESVQLIVLNACKTDKLAPALAAIGIDVVALKGEPLEAEAIAFAGEFYRGLGKGLFPSEAVSSAMLAMRRKGFSEQGGAVFFPGAMRRRVDDAPFQIGESILGGTGGYDFSKSPAPAEPEKTITLRGKISTFGGPMYIGANESEGLALVSDQALHENQAGIQAYFQRGASRATVRNLNPATHYIACRWDYKTLPQEYLLRTEVTVQNPATGILSSARPVDWGPSSYTGRIADLSPGLAMALGLDTDDECEVIVPLPETEGSEWEPLSKHSSPSTRTTESSEEDVLQTLDRINKPQKGMSVLSKDTQTMLHKLQGELAMLLWLLPEDMRQVVRENAQVLVNELIRATPNEKVFSISLQRLEEATKSVKDTQLTIGATIGSLKNLLQRRAGSTDHGSSSPAAEAGGDEPLPMA